jgi:4-amino-4-deoxy-L-arabinose transferase-like glycosyltransferase
MIGGRGVEQSSSREEAVTVHRPPATWRSIPITLSPHYPITLVLLAFAVAAVVVPTLAPVATTDDWAYARSAQILLDEARLTIFPVVAATAVFPIVWGALFGFIFEPTLGIFRLSTVVITALGGLALYGLCRDLGVAPARGALGVATFLFNPLVFVLAFTFMTDAHFMALLVIATWLYAKALQPEQVDGRLVVAGSAVTALAFLTRQQGALIVPAVATYLLVTRRVRFDRTSLLLLIQLVALPTVAIGGYYARLRFSNDVPTVQTSFFREAMEEGWSGTWWLVQRLTLVELMYFGFFTLPIVVAVIPGLRWLTAGTRGRGWLLFALWQAILLVGVTALWAEGARMPYLQQWFGSGALGAPDVRGSRPILLGPEIRSALTIVCLIASLLLASIAARGMTAPPSRERGRAGLLLSIGLWQVLGVMPPSYHYIGWAAGSLDRYLLPLVPLTIALALWALRGVRISLLLGWIVIAALALFSVAGTRDYLVFMRAVWEMGEEAVAAGVPLDRLDAGSGWDGYHLYEYGLEHRVRSRTPKGGPWWVYFYAPATDSAYVVAGKPLPDYHVIKEQAYSSWLQREPTSLYLLNRTGVPWPPRPAAKAILTRPAPGGLKTVPSGWKRSLSLPSVTPAAGTEPAHD